MATAAAKGGFRFYKSGSSSAPSSRAPSRSGSPHPSTGPSDGGPAAALREASAALSSGQSAPPGVDPKVYHIVRRIAASTPSLLVGGSGGGKASQQSRRNSVEAVTDLVLERHREYRRKDPGWVRSSVEGAVLSLGSAGGGNGGGSPGKRRASASIPVGGGSGPRRDEADPPAKRKRPSEPDSRQADAEAREAPKLERSGSSGMLNAGLRSRYKDVAAREAREAREAGDPASDVNGAEESEGVADGTVDGDTSAGDGNAEGGADRAPSKPPATTPGATPKKKKRTKKTPSSRAPSASGQGYPSDPLSSSPAPIQPTSRPVERYSDLGGMTGLLNQVRELVEYPLSRPELFLHLGVEPPRGVLLRGPPGCGKTHLAKAIAGELNVCYFQVSAPELVGGVSGESEQRVRTLFETASDSAPAIVFIDEIDAIAPKRGEGGGGGGGKSMEKRIVAQLLTSMDSIHPRNTRNGSAVMVLGATNRPDAMDPALRRAGRFDREIVLGAPDEGAREAILRVMTREMRTDGNDMDYRMLARKTPGFVGADLRSLTKEAAVTAINRIFRGDLLGLRIGEGGDDKKGGEVGEGSVPGEGQDGSAADGARPADSEADDGPRSNDIRSIVPLTPAQLDPLYVTMSDFLAAVPSVQPSSKREGFATVPDVAWSDIGALANIREELTLSVLEPISHPERFEALGLPLPAGVLLYGPPGCGKVRPMQDSTDAAIFFLSLLHVQIFNPLDTTGEGNSERVRRQLHICQGPRAPRQVRRGVRAVRPGRLRARPHVEPVHNLLRRARLSLPPPRLGRHRGGRRRERARGQPAPHRDGRPRQQAERLRHRRDEPSGAHRPRHAEAGPARQTPVRPAPGPGRQGVDPEGARGAGRPALARRRPGERGARPEGGGVQRRRLRGASEGGGSGGPEGRRAGPAGRTGRHRRREDGRDDDRAAPLPVRVRPRPPLRFEEGPGEVRQVEGSDGEGPDEGIGGRGRRRRGGRIAIRAERSERRPGKVVTRDRIPIDIEVLFSSQLHSILCAICT